MPPGNRSTWLIRMWAWPTRTSLVPRTALRQALQTASRWCSPSSPWPAPTTNTSPASIATISQNWHSLVPSVVHEAVLANISEDANVCTKDGVHGRKFGDGETRTARRQAKKQGLRRIFNEHPVGARAVAFLLLAVVIV